MLAAPVGANAASGAGGCSEYSLSCGPTGGGPAGGPGGDTGPVPAGLPAGTAAPADGSSSATDSGGTAAKQVRQVARANLSATGHLPFTGYPLTPLIEVLLAMVLAAAAIRLGMELRRRHARTTAR